MNKKGFTLVELLAVIAILGVIVIIAVPNVVKLFNKGTDDSMTIVENNTLDAANLLISDSCGRHALSNKKQICNNSRISINSGKYYGFCVSSIVSNGYIPSVTYKTNTPCNGIVLYKYDSNTGSYDEGKIFLSCGNVYNTKNDKVKPTIVNNNSVSKVEFTFRNEKTVVNSSILGSCGIN